MSGKGNGKGAGKNGHGKAGGKTKKNKPSELSGTKEWRCKTCGWNHKPQHTRCDWCVKAAANASQKVDDAKGKVGPIDTHDVGGGESSFGKTQFFNVADGPSLSKIKSLEARIDRATNLYLLEKQNFGEEDTFVAKQKEHIEELLNSLKVLQADAERASKEGIPSSGELMSAEAKAKNSRLAADKATAGVEEAMQLLANAQKEAEEATSLAEQAEEKVKDIRRRMGRHECAQPIGDSVHDCSTAIVDSINHKITSGQTSQEELVQMVNKIMVARLGSLAPPTPAMDQGADSPVVDILDDGDLRSPFAKRHRANSEPSLPTIDGPPLAHGHGPIRQLPKTRPQPYGGGMPHGGYPGGSPQGVPSYAEVAAAGQALV